MRPVRRFRVRPKRARAARSARKRHRAARHRWPRSFSVSYPRGAVQVWHQESIRPGEEPGTRVVVLLVLVCVLVFAGEHAGCASRSSPAGVPRWRAVSHSTEASIAGATDCGSAPDTGRGSPMMTSGSRFEPATNTGSRTAPVLAAIPVGPPGMVSVPSRMRRVMEPVALLGHRDGDDAVLSRGGGGGAATGRPCGRRQW